MASIILPEDIDPNEEYVWMLQKEEYEKASLLNSIDPTIANTSLNIDSCFNRGRNLNHTITIEDEDDLYAIVHSQSPKKNSQQNHRHNQNLIDADEEFARKIQEELDRESAFSLEHRDYNNRRSSTNYERHSGTNSLAHSNPSTVASSLRRTMSQVVDHNNDPYSLRRNQRRLHSSTRELNPFNYLLNNQNDSLSSLSSASRYSRYNINRIPFFHMETQRDFTPEDYENLLALDETTKKRNGLSMDELNGLQPYEYKQNNNFDEDSKTCTICYDEFKNKDRVIALGCFHKFHCQCILEWLKESRTCPLCKKDAITVK